MGNDLEAILDNPFELNPSTGALILNFAVSASMTGYISFQVQAYDLGKKNFLTVSTEFAKKIVKFNVVFATFRQNINNICITNKTLLMLIKIN